MGTRAVSLPRAAQPKSPRMIAGVTAIGSNTCRLNLLTYNEDKNPKLDKLLMPDDWRPGTHNVVVEK